MDYRHVDFYMSHGPDHATASTFQSRKVFPAPPTISEVAVSRQDNAAPLSNQNTAPHGSPLPPPLPPLVSESSSSQTGMSIPHTKAAQVAVIPISDSPTSLSLHVPRSIPASTGLRLIRTFIETIMFLRGQIPTTWQMLQRTLDLERQKMNHPIHPHPRGVDAGARGASPAANQGLIRKLEGLLGPFEEMFVALGDAVMREQRRRAESRSSEMLVISVVFILGSTLSTPKEIYRINVGPIQPTPTLSPLSSRPPPSSSSSSSSSPSPNILQPIATTLQTGCTTQEDLLSRKEENEWIRRLAQLMITNGYEYSATTLPRTRAHLVLSAPPGRDEEGLVPRQTLVLPSDQPREEDEKEEGRTCTATRRPLAPPSDPHHLPPPSDSSCMPPPPCPSTFRYPAYTCRISGPTTYVPVSDNEPGTIYTMEATPPASSIWYQAGPSLPIPPNLD